MEKIEKKLEEIISKQLNLCKENKVVPSRELLDTIRTLNEIKHF